MKTGNIKRYRDGQSRKACVEAVKGIHEGLAFTYRPMLGEEVEHVQNLVAKQEPKTGYRLVCQELAERIVEWSEDAEINFDNVMHLPYVLAMAAYRIVLGVRPSDPIPGDTGEQDGDEDERLKRLSGRLIEGEQAKN